MPGEEFIDEPLTPAPMTADVAMMARGEPGVPGRFVWRGREYRLVGVVEKWRTHGPCRHGSGEIYLRRHWYRIEACAQDEPSRPRIMTIYCDRQPKDRRHPKSRWWIFTIHGENT
jgi:hypothetical protein